jgi:anti-sigma B factor antagonist
MVRMATQPPSPTLSVKLERRPGLAVADVAGELDLDGAPRLCAAIESAALDEDVVVDLSRVAFCDSTGLKALLDASREVAVRGRRLVVIVPGDGPVRRVIEMTGAEEFLSVTAHREPVLTALTRG